MSARRRLVSADCSTAVNWASWATNWAPSWGSSGFWFSSWATNRRRNSSEVPTWAGGWGVWVLAAAAAVSSMRMAFSSGDCAQAARCGTVRVGIVRPLGAGLAPPVAIRLLLARFGAGALAGHIGAERSEDEAALGQPRGQLVGPVVDRLRVGRAVRAAVHPHRVAAHSDEERDAFVPLADGDPRGRAAERTARGGIGVVAGRRRRSGSGVGERGAIRAGRRRAGRARGRI